MTDKVLLKRVCEVSYLDAETIEVQWFNAEGHDKERVELERQMAACGFVYWVGAMVGASDQPGLGARLRTCSGQQLRRGLAEQLGGYQVDVPATSISNEPVRKKRMYRIGVGMDAPAFVVCTHQRFGLAHFGKAQNHYLPTSTFALISSLDQLWDGDPARHAFLPAFVDVATEIMEAGAASFHRVRRGFDATEFRDHVLADLSA